MNKAPLADVNARVVRAPAAKHHQIARAQRLRGHALAKAAELRHGARRRQAHGAQVHVANQAAAVKAAIGRVVKRAAIFDTAALR